MRRNNNSNSVSHNDERQPWTTARCHRLLRQLDSRISSLRRLVAAQRNTTQHVSKGSCYDLGSHPAPKRARYTYGQRQQPKPHSSSKVLHSEPISSTSSRSFHPLATMKPSQPSIHATRDEFPAPILCKLHHPNKIKPPMPSSRLESNSGKNTHNLPPEILEELHTLRQVATEGRYRIYDSIFTWLHHLLRSTQHSTKLPQPKSLLAMCLRKIPACVANIEAWDRNRSESGPESMWETPQVSQEIYEQLEAFGSAGAGWAPLSLVVRAHAISMLGKAIHEGLLEPTCVRLLVRLCLHHGRGDDAAKLVLELQEPLLAPLSLSSTLADSSRLQPLSAIVDCCEVSVPGPLFHCLSELIRTRRLPLSWLSTRGFHGVWALSLEIIGSINPGPSAVEFISIALEKLVWSEDLSQLEKYGEGYALLNLIARVTAAIFASTHRVDPNDKPRKRLRRLLYVLNNSFMSHIGIRKRGARKTSRKSGLFTFAVGRYLAIARADLTDSALQRHALEECNSMVAQHGDSGLHQLYRQVLLLACTIAQCCGRICGTPCHDVLSEICLLLDDISFPDWVRYGLKIDGAFLLAQKTKDLRDLAFAERLPGELRRDTCTNDAPAGVMGVMFAGWRWEEGISEWVVDGSPSCNSPRTSRPLRVSFRRSPRKSSSKDILSETRTKVCQGQGCGVSGADGGINNRTTISGGSKRFSLGGGEVCDGDGRGDGDDDAAGLTSDELQGDENTQLRIIGRSTTSTRIVRGKRRFGAFLGRPSWGLREAHQDYDWDELL